MKRSEVIKIIDETYSVTPEYLWDGETHAVFRHPVSNKWFGIIMEVKKENLHIEGCECSDETEDVMNVKANPVLIEDLLHEQAFRNRNVSLCGSCYLHRYYCFKNQFQAK